MTHPTDKDAHYAYSGPCTHCGHLPDEHGDNYACTRWDRGGDHYTPGAPISSALIHPVQTKRQS